MSGRGRRSRRLSPPRTPRVNGDQRAGEAKKHARRVVMSIFVNPAQFAPSEDFCSYPRSFEADAALFAAAEGDLIFAPSVEDMYSAGFATTIALAVTVVSCIDR